MVMLKIEITGKLKIEIKFVMTDSHKQIETLAWIKYYGLLHVLPVVWLEMHPLTTSLDDVK